MSCMIKFTLYCIPLPLAKSPTLMCDELACLDHGGHDSGGRKYKAGLCLISLYMYPMLMRVGRGVGPLDNLNFMFSS